MTKSCYSNTVAKKLCKSQAAAPRTSTSRCKLAINIPKHNHTIRSDRETFGGGAFHHTNREVNGNSSDNGTVQDATIHRPSSRAGLDNGTVQDATIHRPSSKASAEESTLRKKRCCPQQQGEAKSKQVSKEEESGKIKRRKDLARSTPTPSTIRKAESLRE